MPFISRLSHEINRILVYLIYNKQVNLHTTNIAKTFFNAMSTKKKKTHFHKTEQNETLR